MTSDSPLPTREHNPLPPPRRRVMQRVRVTRVMQLTPHMVRVTLTGDDLGAFAWNGPAAHIKLAFPEDGQTEIPLPDPDGPRPTRMRTYTPLRFDPAVPELDVAFVLHGDGPASSWAAHAQPGQGLLLSGPGPSYAVDPDADWFLLVGDDAALPAIETILAALPTGVPVHALLEVTDAREERPLATPARLKVTWVHRDPDPARADAALEAAIAAVSLPAGNGRIYVGCEAAAMRRIRAHLLHERGLDPATLITRGYWRLGATNYTDRDYGTDDPR